MRALTYQSVAAVDRYALIASFLSRHRDIFQKYGVTDPLSFLAEPVIDERSGLIDWYAEGTGPAKKLTDMTEAEQKPLKAQLHAFADALSACLTEDTQKKDRAPSELTRLALNHPSSTDDLFAVDGRPVLINWGFAPSALGQAPEDIMRMGHGAVPASAPVPETPRPTRTAVQAAPLAAPAGQKAATPARRGSPDAFCRSCWRFSCSGFSSQPSDGSPRPCRLPASESCRLTRPPRGCALISS